jgi:adenylate cyclase
MAEERIQRRLAAVLAADVVGFTRLMEEDEAGTLARLKELRRTVLYPLLKVHRGRVVKLMGDGVLVEFASAVDAVASAVELQTHMRLANDDLPEERRIVLRIGVNLGDVIVEGDDLYGDGVNIAARLQALAEPEGIVISAKVHREVERKLPLNFVDAGDLQLKNVSAPIHVFRFVHGAGPRSTWGAGASAPALPIAPAVVLERPAVAVLPFQNMCDDPAQDYFADGVTEDLITALAAWRWFPVIARNSTFVYKGRSVDVTQIGKDLSVRYVLEGSVRRDGDRVRITAQLIEAASAHHIWAQSYDRKIGDVFALQDEITRAIIGALEPQLSRAEQQRALRKPPESLDAWDLSLQALAKIRQGSTRSLVEAESLLVRAVAMDRSSGYAQSLLALARFQGALFGWLDDPKHSLVSTYEAAREAVELDDGDWLAHALLGIATLWSHGDYEEALAQEEIAIALNPSAAMAYHFYGCVLTFDSQPAEALEKLQAVLRLDPRFQLRPTTLADIGLAHFLLGDCEAAVQFCKRAISEQGDHVRAWQRLAAALGCMGKQDEARTAFAQAMKLQPRFARPYVEATYPFRDPAHTELFLDGLRRAGWAP